MNINNLFICSGTPNPCLLVVQSHRRFCFWKKDKHFLKRRVLGSPSHACYVVQGRRRSEKKNDIPFWKQGVFWSETNFLGQHLVNIGQYSYVLPTGGAVREAWRGALDWAGLEGYMHLHIYIYIYNIHTCVYIYISVYITNICV